MDIFNDQKKMTDNLNKSAQNLGFGDVVKEPAKKLVWAPKPSCPRCYGMGKFDAVDVKGKASVIYCKCLRKKEIDA